MPNYTLTLTPDPPHIYPSLSGTYPFYNYLFRIQYVDHTYYDLPQSQVTGYPGSVSYSETTPTPPATGPTVLVSCSWNGIINVYLTDAQVTLVEGSVGVQVALGYFIPSPSYQIIFNGGFTAIGTGAGQLNPVIPVVPGCTNPAALNYNPAATVDNGTCIMPVLGCTNAGATNYNPAANVDNGSCTFASVPGCTNPRAINYNPSATTDNGSCILPVPGCTIAGSLNYNPAANVNDGSCVPITRGCTVPGAVNYSASANVDDGSCVYLAAPGIPAASVDACCNWTDGDVLGACAWAGGAAPAGAWYSPPRC